jgi:hypothetical protein
MKEKIMQLWRLQCRCCWWHWFMKYTFEIVPGSMIHIPNFIKFGSGIQVILWILPRQSERLLCLYYWSKDLWCTPLRWLHVAWCTYFFFLNSRSGECSPNGSTRQVAHRMAYCTCPEWLWWWRIWWNEDWKRKPKYSEKTCPSANLSTTNPTWPDPGANPGRRGGKPATNRLSVTAVYGFFFPTGITATYLLL